MHFDGMCVSVAKRGSVGSHHRRGRRCHQAMNDPTARSPAPRPAIVNSGLFRLCSKPIIPSPAVQRISHNPGPNAITPEVLREAAYEFAVCLWLLFGLGDVCGIDLAAALEEEVGLGAIKSSTDKSYGRPDKYTCINPDPAAHRFTVVPSALIIAVVGSASLLRTTSDLFHSFTSANMGNSGLA